MIYTTDAGTVRMLKDVNFTGRSKLLQFLEKGEKSFYEGCKVVFSRFDFNQGLNIQQLDLEVTKKTTEDGKLLATLQMTDDVLWRRGSLRIKNLNIPETVKKSLKGRTVEEVVAGTPFGDFIITSSIIDKRKNDSSLRLRCTGEEQQPIPFQDMI